MHYLKIYSFNSKRNPKSLQY